MKLHPWASLPHRVDATEDVVTSTWFRWAERKVALDVWRSVYQTRRWLRIFYHEQAEC